MNLKSDVVIFTDGSSRGNPGPGGFSVVIVANGEVTEIGGREEHTTNNRMELCAAIEALTFIQNQGSTFFPLQGRTLILYSDSSYVINGITKWVFGWRKNNWITSTKTPVENRDLWEKLFEVTQGKKIEWRQVSGHVGVTGNERCDEIATAFADGNRPELYSGVLENYGIKNILDIKENVSAASAKSSSKSHSKAKAYSYISMVGGKIQTHKTWAECEARVKSKLARYKKSLSVENEKEIIAEFSSGK